jgi:transposase
VHKKSWTIGIYTEHKEHKVFSQPPETEVLVNYLEKHFPGAKYQSVYEAGFCGFWIHDALEASGVECTVVNPADVPTKDKEKRQKSDPVDSRKLARSLRAMELDGIYVPTRSALEDRQLLRSRKRLVKDLQRCRNRIKSLLHFYHIGSVADWDQRWSKKYLNWLENIQMCQKSGQAAFEAYLSELKAIAKLKVSLDKEIRLLSHAPGYAHQVQLLESVPGIGLLSAMIFLTEITDINRFASLDQLCSYIGLVPDTRSSGEKENVGQMTKRGNTILKSTLIESAWRATSSDPALLLKYNQLCGKMSSNKAIVRIARKLLNRIRFVLKNQQMYQKAII